VSQFVLDASVVLCWCFPDENAALAQHVAHRFQTGDTAVAPSFWPHEVLNALLAGERRKRISESLVQSFLDDVAALPIELKQFPSGIVFDRIQVLSRKYGLTAYDALTSICLSRVLCRWRLWTMTWLMPARRLGCD